MPKKINNKGFRLDLALEHACLLVDRMANREEVSDEEWECAWAKVHLGFYLAMGGQVH
jgi:hypothetical protein